MQKIKIALFIVVALSLVGCSRTAYVQDNDCKPINAVKVTLTSGDKSKISYTNEKGYAKLDSKLAKQEGMIKYEKEGYKTESYRYPGNVSLIENLEVAD